MSYSVTERIVLAMFRADRMSNSELARLTGMSDHTLGRRLRGISPWTIDELAAIATALHVPISDLIGNQWAPRGSNPQPAD